MIITPAYIVANILGMGIQIKTFLLQAPSHMDNITLYIVAITGCVTGLLSLTLSIFNYKRAMAKDKIAIQVTTRCYERFPGENGIYIQVTNTGFRPSSISQIGFDLEGGERLLPTIKHELDDFLLPKTIEPQHSIRIHFDPSVNTEKMTDSILKAFAVTSAGDKFTGDIDFENMKKTIYKYT